MLRMPEFSAAAASASASASASAMGKTAPPPKRRKVQDKDQGSISAQATIDKGKMTANSTLTPMIPVGMQDLKIQQAKKYAAIQAQQEGWLGNFRSFDSPFGNYLVPVLPTQADLSSAGPSKNS